MKTISLLPPEIRQRRKDKERNRWLALAGVLVLVVYALAYGGVYLAGLGPRNELQAVREEKRGVEREIEYLQQYVRVREQLQAEEELVRRAAGTAPPWGGLLATLGRRVPPGVWLSSLSMGYGGDSGSLAMQGLAQDPLLLSRWLEELYALEGLAEVHLLQAAGVEQQGRRLVQFEINARLVPGPAYPLPGETGEGP